MEDTCQNFPLLRAQDNGFLMHVKNDIVLPNLSTLHLEDCKSIDSAIEKLKRDSEFAIDKGASLPFYELVRDDEGIPRGYRAFPVWADLHVDFPLYGDIDPERVETLISGNNIVPGSLGKMFLNFSPAFRVALIVHHIIQNVDIDPMLAEAFVLNRYEELEIEDGNFKEYGVPETKIFSVCSIGGSRNEWLAKNPTEYQNTRKIKPNIAGWEIRIRETVPKRETLIKVWQEIRNRIDAKEKLDYLIDGKQVEQEVPALNARKRHRSGNPDVLCMCDWVDSSIRNGSFPMSGSHKNWKRAAIEIGNIYPHLAGRWTPDSMRKCYQHRKTLESKWL